MFQHLQESNRCIVLTRNLKVADYKGQLLLRVYTGFQNNGWEVHYATCLILTLNKIIHCYCHSAAWPSLVSLLLTCTNTNLNNATLYKAVGSCSLLAEHRGKQETGAEVSCSSSVISRGIHDKHTILYSCIYTNSFERTWKSVKVHLVPIRTSVYSMNVRKSAQIFS